MNAGVHAGVQAIGRDRDIAATAEALDLLDDEHVREILTMLAAGPKPARDLVAACRCSRPTVYRRLERLAGAGFVTSTMGYDSGGHHRKVFHLRLDGLSIELGEDGLSSTVETVDRRGDGHDSK